MCRQLSWQAMGSVRGGCRGSVRFRVQLIKARCAMPIRPYANSWAQTRITWLRTGHICMCASSLVQMHFENSRLYLINNCNKCLQWIGHYAVSASNWIFSVPTQEEKHRFYNVANIAVLQSNQIFFERPLFKAYEFYTYVQWLHPGKGSKLWLRSFR